jgi:type II secretory pathway pseudopilin PulG
MKLSKKVWLIVGIVIFAIVLGVLFSIYSGQVGERNELSDRLSAAQTLLPGLVANREDLEDQLAQAESLLDKSQAKFPEVLESIEYGEDFFKIAYGQNLYSMARGCGVELTSLTASQPTAKEVGTVTYSVSSFKVVVEGNIDDTLDFIDAIGTGIDYKLTWSFQLPWSVDVKSVNMDTGGATINLDIYGYRR